ncbi:VOC family protein [Sphingomonas phyllosphaerae]|uniref:VOC family protein n=1 Tax=Sphingomonas phyllosphaerae TaxID=257003 RepID=UPI0024132DE6|nr:VOC family protein [Sphingomonas phyllosphaerae]
MSAPPPPRVTGVNHVTLAVSDVARSLAFYRDVLACTVRARWARGAYVEAGPLWLCLLHDDVARTTPHPDYTHLAFSVAEADYAALSARLIAECVIWKTDRSEGASTYFLDPDGHKLEIHVGTLETRLAHYRAEPGKGVTVFDRDVPAT